MRNAQRLLLSSLLVAGILFPKCHAQVSLACSLGHVSERVAPQYPVTLGSRPLEGFVSLLATFAPDGKVSATKVVSGPSQLRFETESYVRGWRAEPSSEIRQCTITAEYRFDRSSSTCNSRDQLHVRAERQDDTHVLMHLTCENW